MTWQNLLENPEAIASLFDGAPSLENVDIASITMDHDGPTVTLSILLRDFPNKPSPRRKTTGVNAVAMRLQLLGLESLTIEGWSILNRATINIERRDADRIQLAAVGQKLRLKCTCGWLRVEGVTGYHREKEAPAG